MMNRVGLTIARTYLLGIFRPSAHEEDCATAQCSVGRTTGEQPMSTIFRCDCHDATHFIGVPYSLTPRGHAVVLDGILDMEGQEGVQSLTSLLLLAKSIPHPSFRATHFSDFDFLFNATRSAF